MSGKSSEFGESQSELQSGSGACWGRRWFKNKTFPASSDPDVTQNLPRYQASEDRVGSGGFETAPTNKESNKNRNRTTPAPTTNTSNTTNSTCLFREFELDPNQNHQVTGMDPDEDVDYVNIIPFAKYDQVMVSSVLSHPIRPTQLSLIINGIPFGRSYELNYLRKSGSSNNNNNQTSRGGFTSWFDSYS